MAVIAGALDHEVASLLMVVALFILNIRNAERVIVIYVARARSESEGANCRISIIHPKWAIEEYARILRSWVWLRPPHPPTRVDIRARAVMVEWL